MCNNLYKNRKVNLGITLNRSFIRKPRQHMLIVNSLGLYNVGDYVVKDLSIASLRGILSKVSYMLSIKLL